MRRLLGDAAEWDLSAALLARIDFRLAGANWQRSGGKGTKPKPLEIPQSGSSRGRRARTRQERGAQVVQRLRNLGLVPDAAA